MIKVSMVEIYMEKIKVSFIENQDLLNPTKDNLKIHEDK